jgi:hypothetical protein
MKTRYLTILTTLAFLGFTVHALAAPPGSCTPWPSCNIASGDGEELYDVEITGLVPGGGTLWQYDGKGVDFTWFQPEGDAALDLTFFRTDLDGPFTGSGGENCFEPGDVPLHAAGFGKFKKSALGRFWFEGYTVDGGATPVLYLLTVTGWFDDDKTWPAEESRVNRMHLTQWEIKVENQGSVIGNMSCEYSGGAPDFMTVDIFLSP